MYPEHAAIVLRDRIRALHRPVRRDEYDAVREQVFSYVDELKSLGWPPERIILAVKQVATEGGIRISPRVASVSFPSNTTEQLMVDMVKWCIERYFR